MRESLMQYRARVADQQLAVALQQRGAVLLEGVKACGKTETAARVAASDVRLDIDPAAQQLALTDPGLLLVGDRPRLLDEWQLAPVVWNHVRRAVDDADTPGQFILTGSSRPAQDARRHSGAGRFATIRMRPMTLHETLNTPHVSLQDLFDGGTPSISGGARSLAETLEWLVWGGWPGHVDAPTREYAVDYLDQIVQVDLPTAPGRDGNEPARRRDPARIRRLIDSVARNTATSAGERALSQDAGLSRDSVREYLAALQHLMLVEPLQAFATHLRSSRRLREHPKWHLVDPSLAAAALGADVGRLLADLQFTGLLFESKAGPPAFLAVVTASGQYAYQRTDGVLVLPLGLLGP
ncbi:MAG: AAA family ATPase [Intrasporangiaceae bacterium]|nr:AAA family ATPase [Intrasporangiaceae bacterium]